MITGPQAEAGQIQIEAQTEAERRRDATVHHQEADSLKEVLRVEAVSQAEALHRHLHAAHREEATAHPSEEMGTLVEKETEDSMMTEEEIYAAVQTGKEDTAPKEEEMIMMTGAVVMRS